MDNKEYAKILEEIATLTRVVGDSFFRVRAFSRAARLIEDLSQPVDELVDTRRLDLIDGIGESIEEELVMIRMTGSSPRHQELLDRIGRDVMELWEIPGLGIKRIQLLYQEYGIASVAKLKEAILANKLLNAPHFGPSIQDKLLDEISGWERGRGRRYPLPEAKALAESLRLQILENPDVKRAEIGGSIRRGKETIGDIDILVTSSHAAAVSSWFRGLPEVIEVIQEGDTRSSVRVTNEIQCDLRILDEHLFGAGLHYFTGSKDHHIQMRLRSKKLGLKISEKGVTLYDDKSETPVGPMDTEEEVFAAVGMQYVPPEIRMGKDEIRLGEAHSIPKLVERSDLTCDPHIFTDLSLGRQSPGEFFEACLAAGYSTVVLAEKGTLSGKGVRPGDFENYLARVRKLDESFAELKVVAGLDVQILENGLLDFDLRLLAKLDWVVARMGKEVSDEAEENTQRVMWGIETGLVSCLAHPTGRHLGVDSGYPLYFDEVLACARDFGTALEMSGNPQELDLNAVLARKAREAGVDLVVASGAGHVTGLSQVEYALQQARRAWLEPKDILNTLPFREMVGRTRVLLNR